MSKTSAPKASAKKPVAKKSTKVAKKSAPAPKKPAAAKKPAIASKAKTLAKSKPAKAAKPTKPARPAPKRAAIAASGKAAKSGSLPKSGKAAHLAKAGKAAPSAKPTKTAAAARPGKAAPLARPVVAPKSAAPKSVPPKLAAQKTAPLVAGAKASAPPALGSAPPPPKRALSGRAAARANATPAQAPLPPPTSRFADRFAPPRPPTRQMANVEHDTPRRVHVSDPRLANAWKSKAGRDMTDAEVLAMPESEYMNDKQLEFFRYTLQALKDSLLSNAGETTEHLREDTSIVPDPADRATIEEEHALELRTRDRERKLLKKITQSLARIEAGEYGFCDETGEPIGLGRLIARPTATLSLEAQQRRELKQKMFGD